MVWKNKRLKKDFKKKGKKKGDQRIQNKLS
jgi:hypothetical protein